MTDQDSKEKKNANAAYELQFQLLAELCEPGGWGVDVPAEDGIVDFLEENNDNPRVSKFEVKSENEELFRLVEEGEATFPSRAQLPAKEATFRVARYGFFGKQGDTTYVNVTEHRPQCNVHQHDADRHFRIKVKGV